MAKAVFDLAAQQGLRLTLLDIGGGFPGWDGSESVYHPPSREAVVVADVGNGSPSNGSTMREAEGGDGTGCADGSGSADGGGSDGGIAAAAPLSLAQVAEVTVPVLDRLFPPSSGVKVNDRTNERTSERMSRRRNDRTTGPSLVFFIALPTRLLSH